MSVLKIIIPKAICCYHHDSEWWWRVRKDVQCLQCFVCGPNYLFLYFNLWHHKIRPCSPGSALSPIWIMENFHCDFLFHSFNNAFLSTTEGQIGRDVLNKILSPKQWISLALLQSPWAPWLQVWLMLSRLVVVLFPSHFQMNGHWTVRCEMNKAWIIFV